MSIPKVIGIEQEYAIHIKGDPSLSPYEASCMLVNAYARSLGLREPGMRTLWDYAHETPYEDIRGRLHRKSPNQQVVHEEDNLRINAGLPNGARFYTDHAHPEYSTAECISARHALACDKAGEIVLRKAVAELRSLCPEIGILLYKNNSDYKGHSYGCHENYLMNAQAHEIEGFVITMQLSSHALTSARTEHLQPHDRGPERVDFGTGSLGRVTRERGHGAQTG